MGLELYLDLLSQPCRAVYLFARKNNISFELKQVRLFTGQHREASFRAVNPLMKLPALKDGDFALAESIAILLYLARKFRTPDHWYPSDLQQRARVDEFLSWQHTGIRMFGSKVFLIKSLAPIFLGHPLPPEKLEGAVEGLNEALKAFEEKFLQHKPFIAGEEISLADLVALVELMQPVGAGHDLFEGRPELSAWRHRVEAVLGKELVLDAHKTLLHPEEVAVDVDQLPPAVKEQLTQIVLKYVQ